ncbi:MAG TPA: type II secretion system secretin GspD [Tepidisphaeraceae bacterium]|nr:type II secretion system secretin GspD [Tepidisphaeraceae bacterium]
MTYLSERSEQSWARRVLALSLAIAGVVPAASAQTTTQPTAAQAAGSQPTTAPSTRSGNTVHGVTSQPGGKLLINFQDANINTVLDELSTVAGFIIVKQVKPEGRVTIQSKQPISADDAISLLNTVLKENKPAYAAIQQDRILKIVLRDDARHQNIPVRIGADPNKIAETDELITQVIPVKTVDAVQLKQDLASFVGDVEFTANASSNALVITDTSANIKRLVKIVAALDSNLAGSTDVKVIHLQYATASGAAKLVNDLFGDQNRGRSQDQNQPRFGFFGGGGFPGSFGDRGSSSRDRNQNNQNGRQAIHVQASADDRTNTVVVTGPPETVEIIEKVVKELDSDPSSDETVFIFRLKNADALNVESVVNNLFGNSTGSRSSAGSSRGSAINPNRSTLSGSGSRSSGGGLGLGSSSGRSSGFGSSGGSGSSSGFGSSRFGSTGGFGGFFGGGLSSNSQQTAAALAGQVTIIADPDTNSMLVRTSPKNYDRVKEILAELDRPVAQVLIKVLIAEVTHDNTSDLGAEFSILNLRASGNGQQGGTNFLIPKQGQGAVVQILETDFTATLRALETQGKLDVLSRPYILASDNQLATITVGQEVPRVSRSQITDNGQTLNTIEYDDIGILLDVVPHINPDGLVILDVAPEISAITDSSIQVSEGVNSPVFNKRSAQSRVGVANGQTVVIGGLMEDRKTQNVNKVPLLGDIPLIGTLFRHKIDSKTKTELLIFLTPHVAADPDMLKGMSQDELNGTKLVPNAAEPGSFQDHMRGMQRGSTTKPLAPTTQEQVR